jgi:hypothetical protein
MSGMRLDHRELVDRLRVVRDRPVRVDRDRDRAHAQEAERDEAEREDRAGEHQHAVARGVHGEAVRLT